MARRSRRKKSSAPVPAILGGSALIAAIAFGAFILNKNEQPTAKKFPLETYVQSCNSLRGNEYSISGEITENAQHDPNIGKYIFLRVDQGSNPIPSDLPQQIGILVPSSVNGPNLETKQNYTFLVNVKREGNLVASSYTSK